MIKFLLLAVAWLSILACGLTEEKSPDPGKEAQKWIDQGMKQLQKQEFDLALSSFNKAIELEPKSAAIYNLLGLAYRFKYNRMRSQELREKEVAAFAKAAPLFKKALTLNPYHPEKTQLEKMIAEGEGKP